MMEYLLEEVYKAARLTLKEIHAFLITDRPLLETFIGKAALFPRNLALRVLLSVKMVAKRPKLINKLPLL